MTHLPTLTLLVVVVCSHLAPPTAKNASVIPMRPTPLTNSRFLDVRRFPAKRRDAPLFTPPRAVCGVSFIGIALTSPFSGRIFSSHRDDYAQCSKMFHAAPSARLAFGLNNTRCGVRRTEIHNNANGTTTTVIYDLRVVVSFDLTRLTEDDRIFDLKCIHSTQNVFSLDAFYDAKDVLARQMLYSSDTPQCLYSLHLNAIDGGAVTNAKVGDVIYHRWQCSGGTRFKFRVYRCFVHNGKKQSFMLVDDNGCSLDEHILPHPEYEALNNTVFAPSKAFRFSKSKRVHFNCLLQVCARTDADCMRNIPPHCPKSQHKRTLPDDVSVEERLLRLDAIRRGRNFSALSANDDVIRLESAAMQVDRFEDEGASAACAASAAAWLLLLAASNCVAFTVAAAACIQLSRHRCTVKISPAF